MVPASSEIFEVTRLVVAAFDHAGVRYFLGGSVASALYGEARSTRDIDFVAAILPHHLNAFLTALGSSFYADAAVIREAVSGRHSFNLIHLETMVKVDIFVVKGEAFERSQFDRRSARQLNQEDTATVYVASAEDIVLTKLRWYRDGGGVSDRQWNDVLGVLKVQDKALDRGYLEEWGRELGLTELLHQAFADAGIE